MKRHMKMNWVVIFFVGIIASLSLSAMHEDGNYNLNQFYDAGTVYNYQSQSYNVSSDTVIYQPEENQTVVNSEDALISYWMETDDYPWNYMLCEIEKMSQTEMVWDIEFLKETGEAAGRKEWTLKQGRNVLELDTEEFKGMNIHIQSQNGITYTIGSMTFWDKLSSFSVKEFALFAGIYFICYIIVAVIIAAFIKKKNIRIDFYKPVNNLQSCFIRVGNYGLGCKISQAWRSLLRRVIFFTIFLISLISTNIEYYTTLTGYKYTLTACIVLVFLIIFISVERPLEKKNWRTPIVGAWFSMWILSIISDFIVDKYYFFTGWIMLFCFTFFYFVVQNMKHPAQMLNDFSKAMQWSFLVNLIGNVIARPENPGQRYCGMYKNPNVFSFYLVIILVFFLMELDKIHLKKKKKGRCLYTVGIFLIVQQLWLAQSLTSIVMAFAAVFFWLLRRRMIYHREKGNRRTEDKRILVFSGYILIGVISMYLFYWGINHIPQLLGTQIIYPEDFFQLQIPRISLAMDVYAGQGNMITDSRLYKKVFESFSLDSLTTGRASIYLQYIQNMNLWGHYYKLNVAGSKWSAHNEILGVAFRYGVFALIPYVALLWYTLKGALARFFRTYERNPYAFCILGIATVSILKLLADKFEQPFRSVGWMAFYFFIGFLFCREPVERREKDGTKKKKI